MSSTLTITILAVASLLGLYGLAGWLASWRAGELRRLAERYDGLTVDPKGRRLIGGQFDGLDIEVVTEEDPHHDDGGLIHVRVRLPEELAGDLVVGPADEAPYRALTFQTSGPMTGEYALWRRGGELRTTLHTSMAPVPQLREMLEAMVSLTHRLARTQEMT